MHQRLGISALAAALLLGPSGPGVAEQAERAGPGAICLTVQRRDNKGTVVREKLTVDPAKTAIVVIDMWDRHWCKTYTARVGNLMPRMNATLAAARKLGMQIVFAPSDTLGFYKEYRQRKAMETIPEHPVPEEVAFDPPPNPQPIDCCEAATAPESRPTSVPASSKSPPAASRSIVWTSMLTTLSYLLGRPLDWDGVKEQIIDDPLANSMLGRPQRHPYHL